MKQQTKMYRGKEEKSETKPKNDPETQEKKYTRKKPSDRCKNTKHEGFKRKTMHRTQMFREKQDEQNTKQK